MAAGERPESAFDFSGGRLCLDFANTVSWRHGGRPEERLVRYADLVSWGRQAGALTDLEAERLLRRSSRQPTEAAAALGRALALREAIYRIFSAVVRQRPPPAADLTTLNTVLSEGLSRAHIVPAGERFVWRWADGDEALDRLLWPVARSAGELLTSEELGNVRECAGRDCGWLFTDASPSRRRRWCDMKVCGNRAKARRHYERTKQDSN